MRPSMPYPELAPEAYQNLLRQVGYVRSCGLEPLLVELVEIRASQLNGCAYCLDLHVGKALEHGEQPRRLHLLAAWREADCFSPRERAALAWAEALTLLPAHAVTEELVAELRTRFSDKELVDLSHALALINAWNRLCVAFLPALPGAEGRP